MKYKVGDKVRIKSWKEIKKITKKDGDGDRKHPDSLVVFIKPMKKHCGKKLQVINSDVFYHFNRRVGSWRYVDWMLEPVEE